jgi:hypothetical protein
MADTKTEKTVADELKAAAAKLRDLAARAPRGPWEWDGPIWGDGPDGPDTTTLIVTNPEREAVAVFPFKHEPNRHPAAEDAAPWIRMMSPVVAEPLAAWLESWDGVELREDGPLPDDFQHALRIARVLNGTAHA